jgi:hypothetical protein
MPRWLRWTEVAVGIVVGISGAALGYTKPATMAGALISFAIIEAAWFVYRTRRGIPDA